jgi:hypothetical protein
VVKGVCKAGESGSGGGVANRAFEMDGGTSPDHSRPYALSQWRNYTLIGMGSGTTDPASDDDTAIEIRDNARPQIYHTIVMDMGADAVDIEDLEDPAIDSAGGWTTAYNSYPDAATFYTAQQQGFQTEIADSLFYNIGGDLDVGSIGVMDASKQNTQITTSPIMDIQRQASIGGYSDIMVVSSLDPRPTAAAMGVQKALPTDGFFTPVDYYGAFSPNDDWTACWSLISNMGVLNTGGTPGECDDFVNINGTITNQEGTDLCAMVLANGQYMFTCGDDLGVYDLDIPTDENCQITLYGFVSGFAPFRTVLNADTEVTFDIDMVRAEAGSRLMEITYETEPGIANPNFTRIWGTVTWGETDLCAMVLANGQNMFTCGADLGTFDLEVPLDSNGQITLYGFVSGFAPYRTVFTP